MAELKNRERLNITLSIEMAKKLRETSEKTGVPASQIIEKSLSGSLAPTYNKVLFDYSTTKTDYASLGKLAWARSLRNRVNEDEDLQQAAVEAGEMFKTELEAVLARTAPGYQATAVNGVYSRVPRNYPYGEVQDDEGTTYTVWIDILMHEIQLTAKEA